MSEKKYRNKNSFVGDRIVIKILAILLKPIIAIYNYFYPEYVFKYFVLNKKDNCHCGSCEQYYTCCFDTDWHAKLKCYKVVRTNKMTGKVKILYDFTELNDEVLPTFCKGDINPLNKRGNYRETNIGEGDLAGD
ncbi:hypothetical protein [Carboxylicivirga marina]|uniref:Uncharacterized protein n=1 Tax=Carboxylicivirga marina TaxID=2800988 RepID=A0ABS1HKD1_9BACT|nr:hypothetical protein [Carboxylicivirga marina]MBK3518060.1 hypothetical protein [Carboxylicivirga marina]